MERKQKALQTSAEEKNCPKCAEDVKAAAAICKHCGYDFISGKLPGQAEAEAAQKNASGAGVFHGLVSFFIGIPVVIGLLYVAVAGGVGGFLGVAGILGLTAAISYFRKRLNRPKVAWTSAIGDKTAGTNTDDWAG